MKILAIDSSMNGCSAGIYDSDLDLIISEKILDISRGQAEYLMPMIDDVIKNSGFNYSDIDLIAVTKGPGAFTGMRIGISTAKALGLALNIPVVGVCTFEAVLGTYLCLEGYKTYSYYGVLLETKRKDYYFAMFDGETGENKTLKLLYDGMATSKEGILSIIGNKKSVLLGDASERFTDECLNDGVLLSKNISFYGIFMSLPLSIARKARMIYKNKDIEYDCNPVYLRQPEIGTPKNLPRKLKD